MEPAVPGAALAIDENAADAPAVVVVRVSNHRMVTLREDGCAPRGDDDYGKWAVHLDLMADDWGDTAAFGSTGLLQTARTIGSLAGPAAGTTAAAEHSADITVTACGDMAGFADPEVTLTILNRNLVASAGGSRLAGDISIGPPLTITVDSDEAAPTLSFSPTNVTIDEGGTTETVLLAEGENATEVGMVKLSVEGDAMVSLMQDGEMLEEMGGYVYVDLGSSNTARLTAMSHSDPDLMDGDMASKSWKLTEDGAGGAAIGDDYWFTVDVRGSTAVPALPLVGQLLLALFLMAGGSRLYRRRQG